jgi:hypothetical protein
MDCATIARARLIRAQDEAGFVACGAVDGFDRRQAFSCERLFESVCARGKPGGRGGGCG